MIGIGNQASEQIDQKVEATAMTRVLNLTNVFELVIDGFDNGPFPQQNLVHELDEAIFHVLFPTSIENQLHWILDVGFREDESRACQGYSAENMAVVRHIAVNLLRQEKSVKVGVKAKRLRAGWDDDYLLNVLSQTKDSISKLLRNVCVSPTCKLG